MLKVGINGMGRIGRALLRKTLLQKDSSLKVTAVNNPGVLERYVHLLKYDSVHGRFPSEYTIEGDQKQGLLVVTGPEGRHTIRFFSERTPEDIPWKSEDVQVVIDASGRFKDRSSLGKHLGDSVKKVIMCAPGKDLDATFVMGINHRDYDSQAHHVISNASCTTNCLAPVVKVMHEQFGIENGFATTVHSYTSDQKLLDGGHQDFRRSRAAALSMIPTTTGAAKSVGLVIPSLVGKLDGVAIRVPTPNVSLVDFCCQLSRESSAEELNQAFYKAAKGELKGILSCEDASLVSVDFVGMDESSCVDIPQTKVIGKLAKVIAWYDNEIGFSNRVLELAKFIMKSS